MLVSLYRVRQMEERVKELLSSGGKNSGAFDEQLSTSCRQFFTQSVEFHAARRPDSYLAYLQANYKPLNRVNTPGDKMESMDVDPSSGDIGVKAKQVHLAEEGFPHPKQVLFSPERVEVAWKHVRGVGAGLCNMGNTCFLNSVLQCLCHTPPLYNYIMSGEHKQTCECSSYALHICVAGRTCMPGQMRSSHTYHSLVSKRVWKAWVQGYMYHIDPNKCPLQPLFFMIL